MGPREVGVLRCATAWLASGNSYIHLRRKVCPIKRYPLAQMSIDNLKEEQKTTRPCVRSIAHILYEKENIRGSI